MNRVVDLDRLSTTERLQLVQDLWDQIAQQPDQVPVSAAQRDELDRRLANHAASPEDVVAWEAIRPRKTK